MPGDPPSGPLAMVPDGGTAFCCGALDDTGIVDAICGDDVTTGLAPPDCGRLPATTRGVPPKELAICGALANVAVPPGPAKTPAPSPDGLPAAAPIELLPDDPERLPALLATTPVDASAGGSEMMTADGLYSTPFVERDEFRLWLVSSGKAEADSVKSLDVTSCEFASAAAS